jgi:tRNA threonylcarbamoyladenosine biosynthesis protein TsaE
VSAPLYVQGADEVRLSALAERLAPAVHGGGAIQLHGDLGAGKTTFARALLRALGVGERVKSPTYSLIESYRVEDLDIHHLDLYRIADAGELEWLGLSDLAVASALLVVEWPERGAGVLHAADLSLELRHGGATRDLFAEACSPRGEVQLAAWKAAIDALRSA